MKKTARSALVLFVSIILSVSLVALGGCDKTDSGAANNGAANDTLQGSTVQLLPKLMTKAKTHLASGEEFPLTFEDAVSSENSEFVMGLTSTQFGQYVEEATSSSASIATFAYQVVLVKCKSPADAKTVAGLIANGFDTMRWICVSPEQCFVQQSGSYVLFVAANKAQTKALTEGFSDLADGNVGTGNTFFTLAG